MASTGNPRKVLISHGTVKCAAFELESPAPRKDPRLKAISAVVGHRCRATKVELAFRDGSGNWMLRFVK